MFMSREQTEFEQDSEILEINMANITHELSELIVNTPATVPQNWVQPVEGAEGSPDAAIGGVNLATSSCRTIVPMQEHANFPNAGEVPSSIGSIYRWKLGITEIGVQSLLCAAIDERTPNMHVEWAYPQTSVRRTSGRCRKFPRTEPTQPIDYDSVVIDLKKIGLNTENRETNDVMRLFNVFRKFHFYLNDVVPTPTEPDLTDYPSEFVKPVAVMPCTMNIQSQIKHIIHRSNTFCYRLLEKLDVFKLADRHKYIECSRSLFALRKMIKQLEPFKVAEFEHKYGVFVNSFGAAQAKNLEILLSQIMNRIRECNIYVEVYLWSAKKLMETTSLPSIETLKKAVAIAGAVLRSNTTTSLKMENETEPQTETTEIFKSEKAYETNSPGGNDGNGGGTAAGVAAIPAPHFNTCAIRFIGV